VTDPARVRRTDPGTPEVCNIYHLHKAFSPEPVVAEVAEKCSTAGWGCIECKKVLSEHMEAELPRSAAVRPNCGIAPRSCRTRSRR
jgi:tryptophanyl-tRNA synthetase